TATEASQTSVAVARNEASCGSPAAIPPPPAHSTAIGAGHTMAGAVVSATITRATQDAALLASSRAGKLTGVWPSGNSPGASLVMATSSSQPSVADTPAKNDASGGAPAGTAPGGADPAPARAR